MKRKQEQEIFSQAKSDNLVDDGFSRRDLLVAGIATAATLITVPVVLAQSAETKFRRIPTQYIAALGDPESGSGNNAQEWGLWR